MTNPTTVPSNARIAVAPVAAALVRNTDNVPSTTQNPCCTPVASATAMAAASATAPRTLLRNHTERRLACRETTLAAAVSRATLRSDSSTSGAPYQRRRPPAPRGRGRPGPPAFGQFDLRRAVPAAAAAGHDRRVGAVRGDQGVGHGRVR